MKLEGVNCALDMRASENLPPWTRPVKVNNMPILALLDTGCTKSIVQPRCVKKGDHLPWTIPYTTTSSQKAHFPAAKIKVQLDGGKSVEMVVGVSKHLTVEMLMGHDIPRFPKNLREALDAEIQ